MRSGGPSVTRGSDGGSSSPSRLCSASSASVRLDLKGTAVWGPIDRVRPPLSAPVVVTVVVKHGSGDSGHDPWPKVVVTVLRGNPDAADARETAGDSYGKLRVMVISKATDSGTAVPNSEGP